MVVNNAEVIGGVIAHQLLAPGARTFYASAVTTMDLWSGAANCGGPEDLVFQMANASSPAPVRAESRWWVRSRPARRPATGKGARRTGCRGSQAGSAGSTWRAGPACSTRRVFSAAQLVLDCDLWGLICSMSEGIRGWDAESLAVDVIDAVKPGGRFLDQEHTLTHMREVWQTKIFDRGNWEAWEANGRPLPKTKAIERAKEIIETHQPYPLPAGASDEIRRIVARFEEEHVEAA